MLKPLLPSRRSVGQLPPFVLSRMMLPQFPDEEVSGLECHHIPERMARSQGYIRDMVRRSGVSNIALRVFDGLV